MIGSFSKALKKLEACENATLYAKLKIWENWGNLAHSAN
jgi:hypothetical protein